MALVNLGNGIAVNPEHIVSVTRSFHENHLIITDVLGNRHEVSRGYGESIYDAEKRVVALLTRAEDGGAQR
ncbi:hypothetical protein [Fuscovulum blasticum]|uniref:hypothetical protein n=1 Tax=Fuscovulum blasticum TaxID=1075 RepID=UPI000D3E1D22|nr:hypothetical protein [Fuscovulum blasticum]AWD21604.1 hypothetical protein B6K69_07885 [Fuscovulum blasticum]